MNKKEIILGVAVLTTIIIAIIAVKSLQQPKNQREQQTVYDYKTIEPVGQLPDNPSTTDMTLFIQALYPSVTPQDITFTPFVDENVVTANINMANHEEQACTHQEIKADDCIGNLIFDYTGEQTIVTKITEEYY